MAFEILFGIAQENVQQLLAYLSWQIGYDIIKSLIPDSIKPVADLISEEMDDGIWIDPFCGGSKLATLRNDLNPDIDADYHMEAVEFLRLFDDRGRAYIDGVFYDPPYSPRQIMECYKSVGLDTQGGLRTRATFWSDGENTKH